MHVVMTTDTTRQDMVLHQPCSKCNRQGIPAWLLGHVVDAQCQPRAASALRAPQGPPHVKFCIVIGILEYYMAGRARGGRARLAAPRSRGRARPSRGRHAVHPSTNQVCRNGCQSVFVGPCTSPSTAGNGLCQS